jgi:arsenate reductase
MKSVLFLGANNSTRTQMAEAILRHRAGEYFEVYSAGLQPRELHPMTRQVLDELAIETDSLEAKDLGRFLGRKTLHYAIILSRPEEPDGPRIYPFALKTLNWPMENPAAAEGTEDERLNAFRHVRDRVDKQIQAWLASELNVEAALSTTG